MEMRNNWLYSWASDKEMTLIRRKMDQCGIKTVSAYLRKMAIDGYVVHLDVSDIKEVVRLLRICSNNLNQYAKRANTDGSIYREDIEDLRTRFDDLFRAGTRIVQTIEDLA